jgi:hypothetical protein
MGQAYWDRVRVSITKFWSRGQELRCTRIYTEDDGTCQMCGHKPIKWHHVLRNQQTNDDLIVGRECIKNYKVVTGEQIVFPERFRKAADYLNGRYPDCVVIVPEPIPTYVGPDYGPELDEGGYGEVDFEEEREMLMDMGLDPDDPDFSELAPHGMSGDEGDDDR